MTIQRMEHVGVVVDDLAAARAFVELGLSAANSSTSCNARSARRHRKRCRAPRKTSNPVSSRVGLGLDEQGLPTERRDREQDVVQGARAGVDARGERGDDDRRRPVFGRVGEVDVAVALQGLDGALQRRPCGASPAPTRSNRRVATVGVDLQRGARLRGMEHLWSRAVATGGNRSQMGRPRKRLKEAESVAVGCDQLPRPQNGKEGVDGSSPSEGFRLLPA